MLTLKQVMEFDVMKSTRMLSSVQYPEKRNIESVSIIEIPIGKYVEKNDFVLSIGIGCGQNPAKLKQFVNDIYQAGASALGLGIGKYILTIPEEVIRFAEEKNFPIIEIPWGIQFSEIQHAVMGPINRLREVRLKQDESVNQKLLSLVLRSHNLSSVLSLLKKEFGHPLLITNKQGTVKGKSPGSQKEADMWTHSRLSQKNKKQLPLGENNHVALLATINKITFQGYDILQVPVQTGEIVQGYLVIFLPEGEEEIFLTSRNLRILEQASTTLTMWFLQENAIEETEIRLRGDFVWSLAKGEIFSWDHGLAQAKSLGFDINLPYRCVVGFPEKLENMPHKYKTKALYNQWEKSNFHSVEQEAVHAGEIFDRKVMVTSQNKELVIYIEVKKGDNQASVERFLDSVDSRLQSLLPGVNVSWGIGRYHQGENSFVDSFLDAKEALKIGRHKKGPGCRVSFEETRVERALLFLAQHPDMKEIIHNTITPLRKYDEERNMDLLRTFLVYHQNQGKISQTSRELNLHRQSLLYRLRKIERLSGLSLVSADDRFLLDLSIKVWTLGFEEVEKV